MFTTLLSLVVSLFIPHGLFGGALPVAASVSDNISGYAWSPNVGWVSANCTDASPACSGTNYGMTVGSGAVTRTLSGYLWSSNIGWITLNAADMANAEPNCDTLGYPPCNPSATMTVADGKVNGWARACSVYASGCSGALKSDTELGGWRGWISLSDSLTYGVLANGTDWTGFAWGGGSGLGAQGSNAVPGWISIRGITTASTPTVYGLRATGNAIGPRSISCGVSPGSGPTGVNGTWTININSTQLPGPHSYTWYGTDYLAGDSAPALSGSPVASASIVKNYPTAGVKTGWVIVTAGTPGAQYFVNCDGTNVTAGADTGEAAITVGTFNLTGGIAIDPGNAGVAGSPLSISAQLTNNGDTISTPFKIRFEIDSNADGTAEYGLPGVGGIAGTDVASVTGGATITGSGSWTPPLPGTYRLRMCVDQDATTGTGIITESNEADNCGAWSTGVTEFTVNSAYDLSPDLPANPSGAQQGVSMTVNGTYDNVGALIPAAPSFGVRFEFDRDLNGTVDEQSTIAYFSGAAAAQLNIPVSASWTPATQGSSYRLRQCVDVTSVIDEGAAESNNCSSWSAAFTVGAPPAPPPTGGACRAVPSVSAPDRLVTWQITAGSISGGLEPFTYNWESLTAGSENTFVAPTNGATESHTYTTGGTKRARVTVTDASGVNPPLVITCQGYARVQVMEER